MIVHTPELDLWRGQVGFLYTWTSLAKVPARAEQLHNILSGKSYQRILEVGCNIGHNLDDLRFTGASLHGVEPCTTAIKKYQTRKVFMGEGFDDLEKQTAFTDYDFFRTVGTAFALPYPTKTFDLVLAAGVLCHISGKDLPEAITEIFRVGKSVLIIDYYSENESTKQFRNTKALWERDFFSYVDKKPVDWGAISRWDPTREM